MMPSVTTALRLVLALVAIVVILMWVLLGTGAIMPPVDVP